MNKKILIVLFGILLMASLTTAFTTIIMDTTSSFGNGTNASRTHLNTSFLYASEIYRQGTEINDKYINHSYLAGIFDAIAYINQTWISNKNFINKTELGDRDYINKTQVYNGTLQLTLSNSSNITCSGNLCYYNGSIGTGSDFEPSTIDYVNRTELNNKNYANYTSLNGRDYVNHTQINNKNYVNYTSLNGRNYINISELNGRDYINMTELGDRDYVNSTELQNYSIVRSYNTTWITANQNVNTTADIWGQFYNSSNISISNGMITINMTCETFTGDAGLCDGVDDTGSGADYSKIQNFTLTGSVCPTDYVVSGRWQNGTFNCTQDQTAGFEPSTINYVNHTQLASIFDGIKYINETWISNKNYVNHTSLNSRDYINKTQLEAGYINRTELGNREYVNATSLVDIQYINKTMFNDTDHRVGIMNVTMNITIGNSSTLGAVFSGIWHNGSGICISSC